MILAIANANRLAAVAATVSLKNCSSLRSPPKKKHMPMTRSKFDRILPISDVLTMMTSSCTRAMIDTINSTALLRTGQQDSVDIATQTNPNVAFRRPPRVSPTRRAISSVA